MARFGPKMAQNRPKTPQNGPILGQIRGLEDCSESQVFCRGDSAGAKNFRGNFRGRARCNLTVRIVRAGTRAPGPHPLRDPTRPARRDQGAGGPGRRVRTRFEIRPGPRAGTRARVDQGAGSAPASRSDQARAPEPGPRAGTRARVDQGAGSAPASRSDQARAPGPGRGWTRAPGPHPLRDPTRPARRDQGAGGPGRRVRTRFEIRPGPRAGTRARVDQGAGSAPASRSDQARAPEPGPRAGTRPARRDQGAGSAPASRSDQARAPGPGRGWTRAPGPHPLRDPTRPARRNQARAPGPGRGWTRAPGPHPLRDPTRPARRNQARAPGPGRGWTRAPGPHPLRDPTRPARRDQARAPGPGRGWTRAPGPHPLRDPTRPARRNQARAPEPGPRAGTRARVDQGAGSAPACTRRAGFVFWRGPGRAKTADPAALNDPRRPIRPPRSSVCVLADHHGRDPMGAGYPNHGSCRGQGHGSMTLHHHHHPIPRFAGHGSTPRESCRGGSYRSVGHGDPGQGSRSRSRLRGRSGPRPCQLHASP